MKRTGSLAGLTVALAMLGCGRAEQAASAPPACPADWPRSATADSTLTLCLAPGFTRLDAHTWQRSSPSTGEDLADFFSVELLDWPADSASVRGWPPQMASSDSCQADCITVDSADVHQDQWSGFDAHTETGLASGGLAGLSRRPVMASAWIISATRRGFAQGWSALPATLDTLRQMLRTVHVSH
ncbi:MAG TPA: hypothetical protein VGP87_16100 [Gemmatimonadales bacterium]|jgi:hypothetical protein|nr:hypothetical protein [Gemmatimonadales bacterium]